jgi:hypothetical protein
MTVLIYVLGIYLAVCWLWGLYLAVRLYTGRRLSRVIRGQGVGARIVRPLTTPDTDATRPASARAAEAIAESRAA